MQKKNNNNTICAAVTLQSNLDNVFFLICYKKNHPKCQIITYSSASPHSTHHAKIRRLKGPMKKNKNKYVVSFT